MFHNSSLKRRRLLHDELPLLPNYNHSAIDIAHKQIQLGKQPPNNVELEHRNGSIDSAFLSVPCSDRSNDILVRSTFLTSTTHYQSNNNSIMKTIAFNDSKSIRTKCWHHACFSTIHNATATSTSYATARLMITSPGMRGRYSNNNATAAAAIDSSSSEASLIRASIKALVDSILLNDTFYFPLVVQSNIDHMREVESRLIKRSIARQTIDEPRKRKSYCSSHGSRSRKRKRISERSDSEPGELLKDHTEHGLLELPNNRYNYRTNERATLWGKAAEAPLLDFLTQLLSLRVHKVNVLLSAYINTSIIGSPSSPSNQATRSLSSSGSQQILPIEPVNQSDLYYISSRPDALVEDVLVGEPLSCLEMKCSYLGYMYRSPPIAHYLQCQLHMLASRCKTTLYVQWNPFQLSVHVIKLDLRFSLTRLIPSLKLSQLQLSKQLVATRNSESAILSFCPAIMDKESYYVALKSMKRNSTYLLHYSRFNSVQQQMSPMCEEGEFQLRRYLRLEALLSFPTIINAIKASFNM